MAGQPESSELSPVHSSLEEDFMQSPGHISEMTSQSISSHLLTFSPSSPLSYSTVTRSDEKLNITSGRMFDTVAISNHKSFQNGRSKDILKAHKHVSLQARLQPFRSSLRPRTGNRFSGKRWRGSKNQDHHGQLAPESKLDSDMIDRFDISDMEDARHCKSPFSASLTGNTIHFQEYDQTSTAPLTNANETPKSTLLTLILSEEKPDFPVSHLINHILSANPKSDEDLTGFVNAVP